MIFFGFSSDFVVAQDVSQNLVFNVFGQSHFHVLVVGVQPIYRNQYPDRKRILRLFLSLIILEA